MMLLATASSGDPTAGFIIFILVCLILYFAPTLVAVRSHKRNTGAIFALNLLLGWTALGWIVAFVWSCTADPPTFSGTALAKEPPSPPNPVGESVMFCPQCGSSNAADARFCSSCGTALSLPPGADSEQPKVTTPAPHIASSNWNPLNRRAFTRAVQIRTVLVAAGGVVLGVLVLIIIFGVIGSFGSAGNGSTQPAAEPNPPTRVVAAFYDAINRKDFTTAWNLLSPTFQNGGSFDKFRGGYATTQSVRANVGEVPGAPKKVRVSLDATDLIHGNSVHSHFEGWWVLTQASDGHWLLDNAHFTKTQTDASGQTAAGNQNETPTTQAQGQAAELVSSMAPGQTATITKSYLCFDSFATLQSSAHMMQVGDNEGFKELYLNGHITLLQAGWHVHYIDNDIRVDFGATVPGIEFRIEGGPDDGTGCWVPATAFALVRNVR